MIIISHNLSLKSAMDIVSLTKMICLTQIDYIVGLLQPPILADFFPSLPPDHDITNYIFPTGTVKLNITSLQGAFIRYITSTTLLPDLSLNSIQQQPVYSSPLTISLNQSTYIYVKVSYHY